MLVDGFPPDFEEPKELGLEAVAAAKIEQALELIHGTEFEGSAIMVEDSGIFLDAFENWPGAASSDVEREIGLEGLLEMMADNRHRGAEYRAVAIVSDGVETWSSTGVCRGRISEATRGDQGFGYDPIFIPDEGDGRTFGEWGEGKRSEITHRARAMNRLADLLNSPSR
uniref:RdgB/HAM1 family non-canonical purine NTP pyrophosphatase (RdgB) n=1 Tax=uncultured marine group II/III euryarchaeote SAT1000_05_B02 TaxID=1456551 RepID=A0A075I426_9EURY|nr:RdgB/HAM1 family non-canonical purine NTP pyrophosphatase (rdgB) [uncultured marine group II/III euryarchaeote SAT1000_05_B02]